MGGINSANFRTHDSTPEALMPEGNKSRVSGVGVESIRPAPNLFRAPVR